MENDLDYPTMQFDRFALTHLNTHKISDCSNIFASHLICVSGAANSLKISKEIVIVVVWVAGVDSADEVNGIRDCWSHLPNHHDID